MNNTLIILVIVAVIVGGALAWAHMDLYQQDPSSKAWHQ
jgi:hypothetical protein